MYALSFSRSPSLTGTGVSLLMSVASVCAACLSMVRFSNMVKSKCGKVFVEMRTVMVRASSGKNRMVDMESAATNAQRQKSRISAKLQIICITSEIISYRSYRSASWECQ